jgi:hypothetical protein
VLRISSGNFAMFTAVLRASSLLSSLAVIHSLGLMLVSAARRIA